MVSTYLLTVDVTLLFSFLTSHATLPFNFDSSALCPQAPQPPDPAIYPNPVFQGQTQRLTSL